MPTVADVLRRYGPEYLARYGPRMPAEQQKVLQALIACRTGQLGGAYYACTSCGRKHTMGRSCGNRHCPSCQQHQTRDWLEKQMARLLPCPYFLITFTVPAELRAFIRRHPRESYRAMFAASSEALRTLAADPRFVGAGQFGFFGVLHTWGRQLSTFHPHIHYVVPGGGIDRDGCRWQPARTDLFVHVKPLSRLYRGKLQEAFRRAGLIDQIDPAVWQREFVTDSRAVGDGRTALQYLAPYVFRVAITDRRIVAIEEQPDGTGRVTYLWKKGGSRRWRKTTVDALEFIRGFLQHVLPSGFQKVRHYGFLHPQSKTSIDAVRWLVAIHHGRELLLLGHVELVAVPPPVVCCPECGGAMLLIGFRPPDESAARGPPAGRAA